MHQHLEEMVEVETLPIRPAVLLVDMQENFVGKLNPRILDSIVTEQVKVIRFCAEKNLPLFILEYVKYGATIEALKREVEYVHNACLIYKTRNNGFHKTGLDVALSHYLVDTVIPIGINASACVWATSLTAFEYGYDVLTAKTLMADGENVLKTKRFRKNIRAAARWYRENTSLCQSADDLIKTLKEEMEVTVR